MNRRAYLWALLCLALPLHGMAEEPPEYQPTIGQGGKNVVWVPTPDALVTKMLNMAKTTGADYVIDLGSGDGRIAIAAAKEFGAQALGIEYNPDLVALSNRNAQKAGVADKVKFVKADLFETDFSKATVLTMYLLPRLNMDLRPKLLKLKPGTRIVSHAFDMEDWKPDETAEIESRQAFLWIVPMQVGGDWRVQAGEQQIDVSLRQKFQTIRGQARIGQSIAAMVEGKVLGDVVRFAIKDAQGLALEFSGRVDGKHMEGVTQSSQNEPLKWTATRLSKPHQRGEASAH